MASTPVCRSCLRLLRHQRSPVASVLRSERPAITYQSQKHHFSPNPSQYPVVKPSRYYATNSQPPSEPSVAEMQRAIAANTAISGSKREADFTETYVAFQCTQALFKECARQADYSVPQAFDDRPVIPTNEAGEHLGQGEGWWYDSVGLAPTFNTWAQITMLHMYLLTVRLRCFPSSYSGIWIQHLTDHFFYEAEHRMNIFHQVSARSVRNKYLKDLYDQWRGAIGAYDEGIIRGDAVLAAAVWRNIFKARDDVDWAHVATVVSFIRRGLRGLDQAEDKRITDGLIKFGSPETEVAIVEQESKELNIPFGEEDEADLVKLNQELQKAAKK